MKNMQFTRPVKTGIRTFLLLAILLFNFGPTSLDSASALNSNNNFVDATIISEASISYSNSVNVSGYDTEVGEPAIPGTATCDGNNLDIGFRTAWYKITPTIARLISFNTLTTNFDTYIALWRSTVPSPGFGDLTFVSCDDDTNAGFQSQLSINVTQAAIDNGTTYYIQVAKFGCYTGSDVCPGDPSIGGDSLVFSASFRNIGVNIGVAVNGVYPVEGSYYRPDGEIERQIYASKNAGPVDITSEIVDQMVASMRVIYKQSGKNVSYSETMGLPESQADTEYYFPWYTTNSSTNSQLRIVNVGTEDTIVDVYIKGVKKSGTGYLLAPNKSKLVVYSGVNGGPVRVVSRDAPGGGLNAMNIIASQRVLYKYNGKYISYSELMGYPLNQLTNEYWFPWYKTASGLSSQLRIANIDDQSTTVQVYIGGALKASYTMAPGTTKTPTFASINNGPVRVVSTNAAVNIIVSMRQIYRRSGVPQSFSEMMGHPVEKLTTEYQFPWYTNSTTLLSSLRIVNVGSVSSDVQIYIQGNTMEFTAIHLTPGTSILKSYAGVDGGPVRVVGTNDIIVSMQMTYKQGGKVVSYSELMGFPYFAGQPITEYLFPWYTTSTTLNSQLRFGYP